MTDEKTVTPTLHSLPASSEDWVPFEAGVVKWLRQDDQVVSGVWRCRVDEQPGAARVPFDQNETVIIVKGRVRVEIVGGPTVELGAGDTASFMKGTVGLWTVLEDVEEFFVLS